MDAPAASAQHCAPMGQPPDEPPKKKGLSAHQSGQFTPHGKISYDPDAVPPERPGGLTIGEEKIVALLTKNLTNKQISEKTKTKIATVKSHVHHILGKINGRNRTSVIIWELRRRLEAKDREILILKDLLAQQGSSAASETKPD